MTLKILREFDPWKSALCTCPRKLSLNPYTGCSHGCLYCYASSYIPRFYECRPKPRLLFHLGRDVLQIEPGSLVSMANSSDPYPPMERELCLTRGGIRILKERGVKLQIVTKSDLVSRDVDLLKDMPCFVAITLTTLKKDLASRLEPGAPPPEKRLQTIKLLRREKVPVSVRLDPLIPGLNDDEIEDLAALVCKAGAQHITSSTYKARADSWKRMCREFPEEMAHLRSMYRKSVQGCYYLVEDIRRGLMEEVKEAALKNGMTFSACREAFLPYPGIFCDGSHLLEARQH